MVRLSPTTLPASLSSATKGRRARDHLRPILPESQRNDKRRTSAQQIVHRHRSELVPALSERWAEPMPSKRDIR